MGKVTGGKDKAERAELAGQGLGIHKHSTFVNKQNLRQTREIGKADIWRGDCGVKGKIVLRKEVERR